MKPMNPRILGAGGQSWRSQLRFSGTIGATAGAEPAFPRVARYENRVHRFLASILRKSMTYERIIAIAILLLLQNLAIA